MVVERHVIGLPVATILVCAVAGMVAGCGDHAADAPVALPSSGTTYRAMSDSQRLAVAASCRERAAAAASGIAADQLRRAEPRALRRELDVTLSDAAARRRPLTELCSERLPFVTPGLRVTFAGATDSGGAYTYQTRSDKPLTIRGTVSPGDAGGYVVARREFGHSPPFRAGIDADGRFVLPTVRLRKQANNSFLVAFHAPPNALRKARFSAICIDCLATGTPSG